jgi:outer membrane lipoprotein-sorting protein
VPRRKQADFDSLSLFVERRTLKLTGLVTVDGQGSSTIRFSHLRENVGLGPSDFNFSFPRGTDVEDIR